MNYETLQLTAPTRSAFAVESYQNRADSQSLVQVWVDSRRAAHQTYDYSDVQEAEIVEQTESEDAPLNPNLSRFAAAIRRMKPGCPLLNFA